MSESRKFRRALVSLKVRLKSATLGDFVENYSTNISRGGLFIASDNPMSVGTVLKFELQLRDESRLIRGVGRVAWVREPRGELLAAQSGSGEGPGMGISFLKMDAESRALVDRIVEQRLQETGESLPPGATEGFFPAAAPMEALPHKRERTQVKHAREFLASALGDVDPPGVVAEARRSAGETKAATSPTPSGAVSRSRSLAPAATRSLTSPPSSSIAAPPRSMTPTPRLPTAPPPLRQPTPLPLPPTPSTGVALGSGGGAETAASAAALFASLDIAAGAATAGRQESVALESQPRRPRRLLFWAIGAGVFLGIALSVVAALLVRSGKSEEFAAASQQQTTTTQRAASSAGKRGGASASKNSTLGGADQGVRATPTGEAAEGSTSPSTAVQGEGLRPSVQPPVQLTEAQIQALPYVIEVDTQPPGAVMRIGRNVVRSPGKLQLRRPPPPQGLNINLLLAQYRSMRLLAKRADFALDGDAHRYRLSATLVPVEPPGPVGGRPTRSTAAKRQTIATPPAASDAPVARPADQTVAPAEAAATTPSTAGAEPKAQPEATTADAVVANPPAAAGGPAVVAAPAPKAETAPPAASPAAPPAAIPASPPATP